MEGSGWQTLQLVNAVVATVGGGAGDNVSRRIDERNRDAVKRVTEAVDHVPVDDRADRQRLCVQARHPTASHCDRGRAVF